MIYVLSVLILVLNVLDVVTTVRILEAGGAEKNVIMAWIMRKTGKGWIAIKAAIAGSAIICLLVFHLLWAAALVTALYLSVLINNIRVMRQLGATWS